MPTCTAPGCNTEAERGLCDRHVHSLVCVIVIRTPKALLVQYTGVPGLSPLRTIGKALRARWTGQEWSFKHSDRRALWDYLKQKMPGKAVLVRDGNDPGRYTMIG